MAASAKRLIGKALNPVSDESLMKQYANGDYAAFATLYARNKGGLYRYLLRQLRDQSLTEDIFQDVWGKVITNAAEYQTTAKFTTWLYTIARNKVIDNKRHMKLVDGAIEKDKLFDDQTMSIDEQAQASSISQQPHALHENKEQSLAIEHCLQKLPRHQLEAFLLREEAGLSAQHIADIVNTNLEATKSRLKVAFKNLRECLNLKLALEHQASSANIKEPRL
jgi:RNA polymerase sigma-70 factor (ECF subfamily)